MRYAPEPRTRIFLRRDGGDVGRARRGRSSTGSWSRPGTRRPACRSARAAAGCRARAAARARRAARRAGAASSIIWSEKPSRLASRSARRRARAASPLEPLVHRDDRLDRVQEPAVDARQLVDLVDGHAVTQRLRDREDAAAASRCAARARRSSNSKASGSRPLTPMSSMRSAFWMHLGEGAADRHHLADALHLAADPLRRRRGTCRGPSAAPCRRCSRAPARRTRWCGA